MTTSPPSGDKLFNVAIKGSRWKPSLAYQDASCVPLPAIARKEVSKDLRTSSGSLFTVLSCNRKWSSTSRSNLLRTTHPSTNNLQLASNTNFTFPRGTCKGLICLCTDFIPSVREHKLRTRGAPFRITPGRPIDFKDAEDHGGCRACVTLLDQSDGRVLALIDLSFIPAAVL